MSVIKVGIIGCGGIANGKHMPSIKGLADSLKDKHKPEAVIENDVQMVAFCEEEARRQGKTVIRLDTWENNLPANTMYPRLGYQSAGATEFFFQGFIHEILNCYEKAL